MSLILALLLLAQAVPPLPAGAPPATPGEEYVHHKPLEKVTRGSAVRIHATIKNQSKNFTPLCFARPGGQQRFHGYPMIPRGPDRYQARLPASFLNGETFEYFVEVRLEDGELKSFGSAKKPFVVKIDEPKVVPAKVSIASDEGAIVSIDGKEVGPAPITAEVAPGKHTISVAGKDGRGAEQQVDLHGGKLRKILVALPRAGGLGTLSLISDPQGARVLLDDQRLGQTPYQGEVQPGIHKLVVEREGYVRQEREVTFRPGHDIELSFSLQPLPKDPALSIESVPPGATVFIDGKHVGVAPWLGALEAGRHQVLLRKQGRREVASDFEMPEGRDLSLRLELPGSEGSNAPHVVVSSKPEGATVSIDGRPVGQTPWAGAVNPGPRELSVGLAGFVAEKRKVDARPNREMEVSFALQRVPGPAKVVVETEPAGAEISVDDDVVGKSPATLQLTPGEHEIAANSAGFKGVAQKITVENGQQASLRLALAPAAARRESIIAVATDPKGARLYVDSKLVGETPFKVKSRPGQHEIRVALDGYITRSAKIKLPENKDFELRVAVSLKRVRGEEKVAVRDARDIARAQLKSAVNCDKQGDWECALRNFQAAYDYEPKPEILFNIGQVRRKKGDFQEAANAYRAYIRAKPDGQLAKRAEQFAERCEAVVKGGAKNVTEDDTEPPVITHTALAKALRGHPVKLEATITDNKSGVFNPQACWRNVYNTEYECAPLALVGPDKYVAEVPAKAVNDGFAYFLEAFDNATNGPARSGAPEVPHSVAVEEPATPLPDLPAPSAESTPAVAEAAGGAVQAKVVEGQGAAAQPAADAHGATQTAQAVTGAAVGAPAGAPGVGGAPGAAGGPMAAQAPHDLLGRPLEPSPGQASPWYLLVHLGAERAVEQYTDSVVDGRVGIELTRRIESNMLALVQFDARTVRQPYRALAPVPGQPAPALGLDEQRYALRGAYGYDFGPLLMPADKDRLTLALMGALEYQRWQNQAFPANYIGLGGYLQARYALYQPFALVGGAGYTWNLVKDDNSQSAVGTPKSDLAIRAGVEFTITSRFALELTYRGDLLALQNDYRFTNGVSVGFGTGF